MKQWPLCCSLLYDLICRLNMWLPMMSCLPWGLWCWLVHPWKDMRWVVSNDVEVYRRQIWQKDAYKANQWIHHKKITSNRKFLHQGRKADVLCLCLAACLCVRIFWRYWYQQNIISIPVSPSPHTEKTKTYSSSPPLRYHGNNLPGSRRRQC